MNNILITIALIIFSIKCFGQTYFEKGYFINNENIRTDCFIKNINWRKNPTQFKYKLLENGNIQEADIKNVKEFSIIDDSKFIRADVSIDISPSGLSNISTDKNPIWEQKQLFLKIIIEGKATLYYYNGKIGERFFYSSKDSVIKQLIFKEYIYDIDHTTFNNTFRIQLYNHVRCSNTFNNTLESLTYTKKDLEKYFINYNTCSDPLYKVPERKSKKGEFHIAVSTDFAYSSLSVSNDVRTLINTSFDKKLINSFALDVEYILPFNNSKWGIVLSPAYQSYHSKKHDEFKSMTIDFESIDLALGLKHYFYLNEHSIVFIECYLNSILNHSIDSKFGYKVNTTLDFSYLEMTEVYNTNFIFGVGFEYKRIFGGLRYYTPQNLIPRYPVWDSEFKKVSLNIGYKILKKKH